MKTDITVQEYKDVIDQGMKTISLNNKIEYCLLVLRICHNTHNRMLAYKELLEAYQLQRAMG